MGLPGLGVSRLLWICSGDKSVFQHHTSGSFNVIGRDNILFSKFLNEGNGKSEIVKREIAY